MGTHQEVKKQRGGAVPKLVLTFPQPERRYAQLYHKICREKLTYRVMLAHAYTINSEVSSR